MRPIHAFILLVLASVLSAGVACVRSAAPGPDSPAVIALVQHGERSELVAVDLPSFTVRERTWLRSLCLSIDGDAETGCVVTAQCGGPDRLADAACGIWDWAEGRNPRYVPLDAPNPLSVVAGGGRALVLHGFEQPQGLRTSVVGIADRSVAAAGHAPSSASAPVRLGVAWALPVAALGSTATAGLLRVTQANAAGAVVEFPVAEAVTAVTTEQGSTERAYVVTRERGQSTSGPIWRIHRLRRTGTAWVVAASNRLEDVVHGVHAIAASPSAICIADADGIDLSDPGRVIRVLDPRDLGERRRIELRGMPAALAMWGETLLVFDGITGELLRYDPEAVTPSRRINLGGPQLGSGDLAVFAPAEGEAARRRE